MATVLYDGKAIIPAPLVTIRKEYQTADDGTPVGSAYAITLRGSLTASKGSPDSTGTFWTASGYPPDESISVTQGMGSLLRKQQALRALLANQGRTLELAPPDGSAALTCNPRVRDIEIPEGPWYQTCPYTISLEADVVNGLGTDDSFSSFISRASEEWTIETDNQNLKTYRLSHSLSATGKRHFDETGSLAKQPWEYARDYVLQDRGVGLKPAMMAASGVLDADSLQAFNYLRSQQVGELNGTFGATETWLCYAPTDGIAAYEETDVNVRHSVFENRTTVTIQGTITGLEVRDNNTWELQSTKWTNAQAKWTAVQPNLLTRAQTTSEVTLNPTPTLKTSGFNEVTGVITYSYEYDTRPVPSVPGALTQIVHVNDLNPADVFAILVVPGETTGPVLQTIGTVTERKRTINIEIQMSPASVDYTPSKPDTISLVLDNRPNGSTVYLAGDSEDWVEYTGRYTRNTTYAWKS